MSDPVEQPAAVPLDCRVVALTHYLPPYTASVLCHTGKLVRDLRVLLSIAQEPNRQFGNTWEGLNVGVQKSWMLRRHWKHRAGFKDELYLHFPYDTISQLRRAKPDIVFSFELGFRSLTSALYCKTHGKKLAICVCVSEHTEKGRGIARSLLRRILLRAADAITYNGPSCRAYLKSFGVPDHKLFHFPYACSDLFRYEGPLERAQAANRRLLCIGQLTERKGVLPLVQSLSNYCVSRPQRVVEIDFVGTGNHEQAMRDVEMPGNLRMRLLGHRDYREICQAMEESGVLVFPTLADEWGLVVNEAMQAGMPVLGSCFGQASATLIRDGENGWQYQPADDVELTRVLDALFATSDEELLQMRVHAQATVRDITPANVAAGAANMFRQMVGK